MLVGMIGCPGSGKTTLALGMTLQLKKNGLPAIYLEEYATRYIILNDLSTMTLNHQTKIEEQQTLLEKKYNRVDRIVISDSSLWLNHYYRCKLLGQKDFSASNRYFLQQHYDILFGVFPTEDARGAVGRLEEHRSEVIQEAIQEELRMMCTHNGVSFIPITAEDVSSAVEIVERAIAKSC